MLLLHKVRNGVVMVQGGAGAGDILSKWVLPSDVTLVSL